ncbi:MAG: hypothetical protein R6U52_09375 [Kosmotogaceae bacterium]
MAKKCAICGKDVSRKNSVKIESEWYCLQCAAKLKELEEKSGSQKSYVKYPEVLSLSIENPGLPIIRYFQMITITGIIYLGACGDYRNEPEKNVDEIVTTAMEGVYFKLLGDLEKKAYQLGANTILGVRVNTTSFSTIDEEFGLIVTLSGTPVLTEREREKPATKKNVNTQEKDKVTQSDEFEFSNDFFDDKFKQIDESDN